MLFPTTFPTLLTPDPALAGALAAAIAESVVTFPSLGAPPRIAISVVAIDESGDQPRFKHAGFGEHDMHYSASLLKVAAMFDAFELRQSASDFALTAGDPTQADLFARMSTEFDPTIASSSQLISSDPNVTEDLKKPKYTTLFEGTQLASGGYLIKFTPSFSGDLSLMIVESQDEASGRCVKGLGYSWINGLLEAGGLFNSATQNGIWLAGTFTGTVPVVRIPSLNDGLSAQAMTCFDMANLYALLFEKTTIDARSSDSICEEMLQLLADSAVGPDPSWMQDGVREGVTGLASTFTITHTKIGDGPLKTGGSVASEATIVQHNPSGKEFMVVWQNVLNNVDNLSGVAALVQHTIERFLVLSS